MSKTVLMVDDSKTTRAMVTFTLRRAGYTVIEAEDGCTAIAALDANIVDCVITDLDMPNMNGLELIRDIRISAPHRTTPIVMLTTDNDGARKEQGQQAGATKWLSKPFHPKSLVDIVAGLVAA